MHTEEAKLSELDAGAVVARTGENGPIYYRLPSFFVIGVMKCGTREMFLWLSQHPNLKGASRTYFFKEVDQLAKEWPRYAFREEFCVGAEPDEATITFERAPNYFVTTDQEHAVSGLVHRMLPSAKLIVLLRDPGERAYSHFQMKRRHAEKGKIDAPEYLNCAFDDVVHDYLMRGRDSDFRRLFKLGYYAEHLEGWLAHFPRSQLCVLLLEEFKHDPFATMDRVQEFLSVPRIDYRQRAQQGERGWWTIPGLVSARHSPSYAPMSPTARRLLTEHYAPWTMRLRRMFPGLALRWDDTIPH
ncbi:MAG: sulfotransferase domain-containing protein [Myxococcota bacterium]